MKVEVGAHVFEYDSRVAVAQFPDHSAGRLHVVLCQSPTMKHKFRVYTQQSLVHNTMQQSCHVTTHVTE